MLKIPFKIGFMVVHFLLIASLLKAQQKWEFNFHYGSWNINFARPLIESFLEESMDKEIKEDILAEHPGFVESYYNREATFDSSGNNLGFEARFYPGGEKGSFSIGFSIEKTKMELLLDQYVKMDFTNGSYADLNGDAEIIIEPLSYNMSFRWDIKPSWMIHSYIGFGFGIAPLKGNFSYNLQGKFFNAETNSFESESESQEKNFQDIEDIPKIFPILQINLGLKGRITENIYLHIDAGLWDGLLIRGGISLRI